MTPDKPAFARDILGPVLSRLPGPVGRALSASPRLEQAARDVTSIVWSFAGPRRPTAQRYSRATHAHTVPGERRLRVLEVVRETADTVTLVLERPEGFTFAAGQFLTFILPVGGRELRRSYSLSSAPSDATLRVTVKRVPGGLGSGYLHDHVKPGAHLRVRGPSGDFVLSAGDDASPLLLIGGGSGVTPLRSLAEVALAAGRDVTLVLANRGPAAIVFEEAFAALAARHPRFTVVHVLEKDHDRTPGARPGRVDRDVLASVLRPSARVYVCGPEGMMDAVTRDLASLGVPGDRVLLERFLTVREALVDLPRAPTRLHVLGRDVPVAPGTTLLEAALAAGVDVDFSCTMGGCGACKVRLSSGDVVSDEPNCLRNEEREAGMILTCVSRPKTDVTLERPR